MKRKVWIAGLIIMLLVVIDQAIKVTVKLNMSLGDQIVIFDWFRISFIENNGMAWGMELGSKLFLSIFRVVAVAFLLYYIYKQIKANTRFGYVVVLCMICAGAAGNIFDSLFYGKIFSASEPFGEPAHIVAWGHGYADMLMGKVVDMFYFPLIHGTTPDWCPLWGGENFIFFSPVFNFADACITVGVALILIFYRKEINGEHQSVKSTNHKS